MATQITNQNRQTQQQQQEHQQQQNQQKQHTQQQKVTCRSQSLWSRSVLCSPPSTH
jgi:hypothetical protein